MSGGACTGRGTGVGRGGACTGGACTGEGGGGVHRRGAGRVPEGACTGARGGGVHRGRGAGRAAALQGRAHTARCTGMGAHRGCVAVRSRTGPETAVVWAWTRQAGWATAKPPSVSRYVPPPRARASREEGGTHTGPVCVPRHPSHPPRPPPGAAVPSVSQPLFLGPPCPTVAERTPRAWMSTRVHACASGSTCVPAPASACVSVRVCASTCVSIRACASMRVCPHTRTHTRARTPLAAGAAPCAPGGPPVCRPQAALPVTTCHPAADSRCPVSPRPGPG